MNIAEEMTVKYLRDMEWPAAPGNIMNLIIEVAYRGRAEAVKALSECKPNREYSTYIQEDEAEFHILDNKWERKRNE